MANLTPEQEAIDRAHFAKQSDCLPNCNRHHTGDRFMGRVRQCSYCYETTSYDVDEIVAHNDYHLAHPESITR